MAGFDETTLRSGPAGDKKYVSGAFTEEYSAFWLGARSLEAMADAGILPDFAGIVVSDRYQNYFGARWERPDAVVQDCFVDVVARRAPAGLLAVGQGVLDLPDRGAGLGIQAGLQ